MTKFDKEKLIEAIWYNAPCITLRDKNSDKETIVIDVEDLKQFIRDFECEATEGSTEEKTCCAMPNYEAMYNELAERYKIEQEINRCLRSDLDKALASLRTFEFVYGRKLNGIC